MWTRLIQEHIELAPFNARIRELKTIACQNEEQIQIILAKSNKNQYDSITEYAKDCLKIAKSVDKMAKELFDIHQQEPIEPADLISELIDLAIRFYDMLLDDDLREVEMDRETLLKAKNTLIELKQAVEPKQSAVPQQTKESSPKRARQN